jgi:hypothetical protein
VTTIVFEELTTGSTVGDGSASSSLPRIRSFGSDQGNTAVGILPTISSSASGLVISYGSGEASLPAIRSLGFAVSNYGVGYLPTIRAAADDGLTLVPRDGTSDSVLPAISSSATGFVVEYGTGVVVLPRIRSHAFESVTEWGVGYLPLIVGGGLDIISITDYASMQATPGYLLVVEGSTNPVDILVVEDSAYVMHVVPVLERLRLDDSVGSLWRTHILVEDGIDVADVVTAAYVIAAQESLALSDLGGAFSVTVLSVVDTLIATGLVSTTLQAVAVVTDAIVLDELAQRGFFEDVADVVITADEAVSIAKHVYSLVESIVLNDLAEANAHFTVIATEALALDDNVSSLARFTQACEDSMLVVGRVSIFGEQYDAWVMNARTKAFSQFTNYNFNSFATFNGVNYAMGEQGLYRLDGETDAGALIDYSVKTGLLDLNKSGMKRVLSAYLHFKAGGEVLLKVNVTSDKGVKEEHWFKLDGRTATDMREDRIKDMGQGIVSSLWQFEITRLSGSGFEFDSMRVLPVNLTRRV